MSSHGQESSMETETTSEDGAGPTSTSDASSCSQDTNPIRIYNLPVQVLGHASSFLSAPSRALFAIALDNSRNELRRDVSSALVQRQWDWDTLDFGEIEKQLAAKLTDDDIKNVLVRIDAANRVTRLRLTNCVNITGTGLQPISGSTTIEVIDLSLVQDSRTTSIC
ncbi:hypothetical protein QTG54_006867 [Skeletonema marinoi]|uniref:Uncharacterized protein n=1 Tax=Skeletonema marinoi TaxID=267567 RepID=A0AAD9DCF5_9STRA|nr:hypothetical protein QTG54_006867 [Skeletonema marinoi]